LSTSGLEASRAGLLAALCTFAVLGCASFPRPAQPFVDANAALSAHGTVRERVQSIRAEARVDQRGDQGRIKGTVLMFVQRPDRVRFDAMTQFGPAAILTSDGARFAYADLRSKRFMTGDTCPQNIARLLNLPLSVDQTTQLLLGGTPVIEHTAANIEWNRDGFYRISLSGEDGSRQEVDYAISENDAKLPPEQQGLRLVRSEIYTPDHKSRFRATYEDYRMLTLGDSRIAMPFQVRVEQPRAGTDTLIRFKEITLNAEVPANAFMQDPMPGMQQEEASCD
jgi:outer membrane lipoprotein-sorting protein